METILNASLGIGILMLLLLLFKRTKKQKDYLFFLWIGATLFQIAFYLITIYHFDLKDIWAILGFGLPLLGAPLLFLYILSLTRNSITLKIIVAHLIWYPLYALILFVLQETDAISIVASNGFLALPQSSSHWTQYYAVPLAISGLVYCIWDLAVLNKHKQNIGNLFSFDEKINLRWLHYVVYSSFILFILASFLIFGATQFQLFPIENTFALVGIALSTMLVAFGFYGFRQTAIFSNMDVAAVSASIQRKKMETASYSKSGLTNEIIEDMANNLSEHMEATKPYLNEDLSLPVLAAQCELQQAHLSQVINQQYQMNFYDFVNQYRIEEAKKRLSSTEFDHLSVLGIAFDCGFKSKSSFNRYFKKYTGVSPSEFKKNPQK